ncbi:MAG: RelA/SpoT family protein [Eubacteriales bacterium]|jgi:guanosine-3',5'-bis(diphosphate) 3'-pyrophosphohydrolase
MQIDLDREFSILEEKIAAYMPGFDRELLRKALDVAYEAHDGQMRKSGEPYIIHPIAVANIIAEIGLDLESVMAGLLHDVIEDTSVGYDQVKAMFGKDVADLVDGVTKLGQIPYSSREEQQVENLRKMILAMAKDVRVILIKLADRLHNMRTIAAMPEAKQRLKALETMEVYSPLAHRLGMSKIKTELEDISIRYLDPVGCEEIIRTVAEKQEHNTGFVDHVKKQIHDRLEKLGIKHHIEGRTKHVYSIYRKIYGQGKSFDELYDLFAVRVIVDSVIDCYNVLGVVHDMYTPIPGRFKDYISTPKPNMYQSLHTTVIGVEGLLFEVQIRTWEMHKTAEYGIAAHWKYKAGVQGSSSSDQKLAWIRQLLEVQKDTLDPEDFMRTLKIDMFSDEVFVFTPQGDVINLPLGANAIDFAYAIHTQVGNHMNGCKVNGRIMPIDYVLQNGDIIEVITSANGSPNLDWVKMVKTSGAKNKIRQWFKREKRDENIVRGKEEVEKELRKNGYKMEQLLHPQILPSVLKKFHINDVEDLYASVGYGGISVHNVLIKVQTEVNRLARESLPQDTQSIAEKINASAQTRPQPKKHGNSGVVVEGVDNVLIKFAKCCNPLPGDEIIGFITKGFGVSIHKKDCPNAIASIVNEQDSGRWIPVHWENVEGGKFESGIQLVARDRIGLLADVVNIFANMHMNLHNVNTREGKDGFATLNITVELENVSQLQVVMKKLSKVSGVIDVRRGVQ